MRASGRRPKGRLSRDPRQRKRKDATDDQDRGDRSDNPSASLAALPSRLIELDLDKLVLRPGRESRIDLARGHTPVSRVARFMRHFWRRRPRATIGSWRPATSSRPSRRRRPRTGSCSRAASFDWLCEQGHVGLERVAKARRDPALVAPVTAARRARSPRSMPACKGDVSVLHAARENLLLPVDLRARADRDADRGRRAAALHLVPARRARAVSRRRRRGVRPRRAQGAVPRLVRDDRRRSRAASPPRASASAACSGSGPTTMRCATSRRRRWATRRSFGSRPWTATARPPTAAHRASLPRC